MEMLRLGDSALTCVFSKTEWQEGKHKVLMKRLGDHGVEGGYLLDIVVSFGRVSVYWDVRKKRLLEVEELLVGMVEEEGVGEVLEVSEGRYWDFPVCYDGLYGLDLEDCARESGLSQEEVVRCHEAEEYEVLLIGFLPGFPFMGHTVPSLNFRRRKTPRVGVPSGSVAVAGGLTAIYPWESPGGWHILGVCPVPLFCPERGEDACLLRVGDKVKFRGVGVDEYRDMCGEMLREGYDLEVLLRE